eukprot:TRINITY_DN585_c0_g1_i7.p1 TRINITY_DN585_c0_g1~~TRINITY_DN585_c0_g1_i7.p1  ORF type:complete len:566 (+),score=171.29 TRINITY_DN585_c0_g1_i7:170-1699(+)
MGYKGPLGGVGLLLWVPFVVWLFLGVAIVADEYFTPALEKISKALQLSPDVAGATFLAAASSAPEFFTSFADTFLMSEDGGTGFGVGTIVGSAVFNILIICAVSCIPTTDTYKRLSPTGVMLVQSEFVSTFSLSEWEASAHTEVLHKGMLHLDWYPLLRDTVFYVASILVLILTVATGSPSREHALPLVKQGCVHWYESIVYLFVYMSYIVAMKYSSVIDGKAREIKDKLFKTNESGKFPQHSTTEEEAPPVSKAGWDDSVTVPVGRKSYPKLMLGNSAFTAAMRIKKEVAHVVEMVERSPPAATESDNDDDDDDDDDESPFWETTFTLPSSPSAMVLWLLALPLNIMFKLTIPAVTRRNIKEHYVLAFAMSILWIAAFSAMMVKVVGWMGAVLGIDNVTMGLVVLAAGTSVPDALGSYNEAKRGEANAAVSNALGSNVFDICMGLGAPWFLYSLFYNRCFQTPADNILIPSIILFFVLLLFLTTLALTGMKYVFRTGLTKTQALSRCG